MLLPTISISTPLTVPLLPLTPSAFAPFGTCITSPLPQSLSTVPPTIPTPLHPSQQPVPICANQSTALKTSPISPLTSTYPSDPNKPPSKALISMFSCFPRPASSVKQGKFNVSILERHPYTSQTFSPLGLSSEDESTAFIVIVAPSLSDSRSGVTHPPDLSKLRAFVARGNQAVTYGVGTWHAPMVVLGETRVDFVVMQFVNGVPEDDCQEVRVGGDVGVDLARLKVVCKRERAKL